MIPPELARMSVTTRTPLSARAASPSGVDEEAHGQGEQLPPAQPVAAVELADEGARVLARPQRLHVQPLLVVEAAAGVGHGHDARPLAGEPGGSDAADVPAPLHGDRRPLQRDLPIAGELLDQVEDAAPSGILGA